MYTPSLHHRSALGRSGARAGALLALAIAMSACAPVTDLASIPATPAPAGAPAPAAAAGSPAAPAPGAAPAGAPAPAPAPAPAAAPKDLPSSTEEASRFVGKATFGATQPEIDRLMQLGYSAWIEDQFTKSSQSHLSDLAVRTATLPETVTNIPTQWPQQSFWRAALSAEDVLRQRVAFALSQIFVVSQADPNITPRMAVAYYDILARNAFGDFRTLLEQVALSPAMGTYLSHLANRKEDLLTGRLPDENFAREIMQLFTIGLYELNPDGMLKLDARREPIETYDADDIRGLARVFTGFSWGGPDTSPARFINRVVSESNRDIIPMQGYAQYHETGPKTFLGTTVNASTPEASLKAALDVLVAHPNVGPFIGRQLIQRLVTSNPSPAYVGRVSAAFANNGQGQRGDMKAVIRAVLLDPEAFTPPADRAAYAGRLREPLLRMTALLRATGAKSNSGQFAIGTTDDPGTSLGQSALRAPSVFNFYRPSYVPPNTTLADSGLVSPELQITHEISTAGWINTARTTIEAGIGGTVTGFTGRDVQSDWTPFLSLAGNPDALVDRLILLLAPGQVPTDVRNRIRTEVAAITIPATEPGAGTARRNRVNLAVLLLTASPEFLVQR
ncbi:MAG: DUF1800 domain-containing protein [Burkholderiaceae bacterium]